MKNETLYVKLLGTIELKNSYGVVNRQTLHSGRLTHLLLYFLLHRREELTMQRLSDVLWKDKNSENPNGALKNLMYRLRNSLKVLGKQDFILTTNGAYRWNPEIPVSADFEELEKRYQKSMDQSLDKEERIRHAEEILELYQGHLPENLILESWALPIDTYYFSMYLDGAKLLAKHYMTCEDYRRTEQVSSQALIYAGYDEELHAVLIESLIKQDKQALAVAHYNKAIKQFHEQEGAKERAKLDELYERLLAVKNMEKGNLEQVVREIHSVEDSEGVFICEYGVFKEIYRLERRRKERSTEPECILLMTLTKQKELPGAEQEILNKMMRKVLEVLVNYVRRGDAAARYSDNQYILLLANCNVDSAKMVAERIMKKFRQKARAPYVQLSSEIWEVSADSGLSVEEIVQKHLQEIGRKQ